MMQTSLPRCAGLDNKGGKLFSLANQTANEGVAALRTVHSYNMQDKVVRIYSAMLQGPNRRSLRNALSSGTALGIGQCIMFLFYALAFWYGGREVLARRMTALEMLKVFFSLLLASMGVSQAQVMFPDVAKGKTAVARIFRGACCSFSIAGIVALQGSSWMWYRADFVIIVTDS